MKIGKVLSKKRLLLFLVLSAVIIFVASLEVLVMVKSADAYDAWRAQSNSDDISAYVAIHMSLYFSKIIVPMVFSFFAYYTYKKLRVNGLFVFIWSVLFAGNFALSLLGKSLMSPLVWIYGITYVILIGSILSISMTSNEEEK